MKKVHFLGIGGSGASAAAAIAISQGFEITGCDKNLFNEFTTGFDKKILLQGHSASHLEGVNVNLLVITPAILSLDPNNEELVAAKEKNIPVLTWQEFMGKYLMKGKTVIAVCGTHGKSTTTAMIGLMLEKAGFDPTVELGAIVPEWQRNFKAGRGEHFVVEADEFNDNLLNYHPDITVVTNIEMDHPEYFKNFEQLKNSFKKFFLQTRKYIVANIADENVAHLLKDVMKESKIICLDYSKNEFQFTLKIPGEFNISNAKAVQQVGLILNINPHTINKSLVSFQGIGRRFEHLGKFKGAKVYTDFGHHPTEIRVTMEAAREKFPGKKLWLVYEPHMFSRTKFLFDDFVKVFKNLPVDQTLILDIYPSREVDTGLISSKQLVDSIGKKNVRYASGELLKELLNREVGEGDIVFFMGAGDIDKLARKLITK
ncbi:UDP-N-acetylmuramate--L-alanine ligase [Candidatus Daviesbacteria bacterium]|nr:UDP-N-acetylmuramate--L-alanine ligase [Candidatus Daviesbacteria bacterium]